MQNWDDDGVMAMFRGERRREWRRLAPELDILERDAVCMCEPWKPRKIKFLESTLDLAQLDKLRSNIMEINDRILPKVITMESEVVKKGGKINRLPLESTYKSHFNLLHIYMKCVTCMLLFITPRTSQIIPLSIFSAELKTAFFNLIVLDKRYVRKEQSGTQVTHLFFLSLNKY